MAEWSNAAVLKTVDLNGSGGSNPSLSAEKWLTGVCRPLFLFNIPFFEFRPQADQGSGDQGKNGFIGSGENPVFRITKKYVPLNR